MKRKPLVVAAFLSLLGMFWWMAPASAATHALLVGVSGYPSLSPHFRLQGPPNDVQLMHWQFVEAGMPTQNLTILADGVANSKALPTRANILAYLDQLAQRAENGDWVVVYMSGHGSQQPQLEVRDGYREPDGLDEIFLPYDVGRWNGKIGSVENAIVDDEIGTAIDKIRARGATVWAIFDTCHAGDMTRSAKLLREDGPRLRYVHPSSLEVPGEALLQARVGTATRNWKPRKEPLLAKTRRDGNGVIAFYASQPDEPAAEEILPSPAGGNEKKRFGLFTYYLVQAMQNWQKDSFKTLAERIGSQYRHDKRPFPTPLFTGGLEQVPNFGK